MKIYGIIFFVIIAGVGIFLAIFIPKVQGISKKAASFKTMNIPSQVLKFCLDGNGKIADAGEAWEATDVIRDKKLPRTRFLDGCSTGENEWRIAYEAGGYAYRIVNLRVSKIKGFWTITQNEISFDKQKFDCGKYR